MKHILLLPILALAISLAPARTSEPAPLAKTEITKLLGSLSSGNYADFVADGDSAFHALPQTAFASVVSQIGAKLKAGYNLAYLGELKQHGYDVTLWKLSFPGGGDDLLATLSIKDGKVDGFWIK